MRKIFFLTSILLAFISISAHAAVNIQTTQGWFESGCVTWSVTEGVKYTVYIRPEGGTYKQIDNELIRSYGSYGRADMVGLKAGNYQFKVVASNGEEAESSVFTATAHDRSGFAHVGMTEGIGAYKNDGTLKSNAKVLYVHANNAKTVSTSVTTSSKGATTEGKGLQDIIYLYQKGYDTTPLCIRIIGTIKAGDMDRFDSSEEGLQIKGKSAYSTMPITIEGIGDDAAIYGFGILVRNCKGLELRNFAVMLCMDDCISLDTENSNIWIHNMDLFYGEAGSAKDQAKGDGTIDIKGKSKNVTLSYNHFIDAGKSSLGGMKSETTDCWHTYHHNWFDHSDSRHPRVRTMFFHVYNNYFDGNSKYGVGMTSGGSAFVEQNYFRNCKYPMLISKQGTDAEGDGTFSGESGGVIKAYDNAISGAKKIQYYDGSQTDGKWDAVKVDTRDAKVSATALTGGTAYNNDADAAARTTYIENKIDNKDDVPSIVEGKASGREGLGAGRMNGGDFKWTFNNSVDDTDAEVNTALKSALKSYKSSLVGFLSDGTPIGGNEDADDGKDDNPDDSGSTDNPDNPGSDDNPGGTDTPTTGTLEICNFLDKKPSSTMVSVSGNYSNSKGTVSYEGTDYGICVKMETATVVTIKPTFDCTVTLIFDATSKKLKIDDTTYTTDSQNSYSFDGKANQTYTLKKGDSMNLYLVVFTPKNSSEPSVEPEDPNEPSDPDKEPEEDNPSNPDDDNPTTPGEKDDTPSDNPDTKVESVIQNQKASRVYTLDGSTTASPYKGKVYIVNGKKYIRK